MGSAVEPVCLKLLQRHEFEAARVRCFQHDRRRKARFQSLTPSDGAKAPTVTGLETRKPMFWSRCCQIITSRCRKYQKCVGQTSADEV